METTKTKTTATPEKRQKIVKTTITEKNDCFYIKKKKRKRKRKATKDCENDNKFAFGWPI